MKTWKIVALLLVPPLLLVGAIIIFAVTSFVASAIVVSESSVGTLAMVNVALGLIGIFGLVATPICWTIAIIVLIRRK